MRNLFRRRSGQADDQPGKVPANAQDETPEKTNDKSSDMSPGQRLESVQRTAKQALLDNDAERAVKARPLTRVQLLLARLSVFDFFKHERRLLAKRPFSIIAHVGKGDGWLRTSLTVETALSYTERGAVHMTAVFYSWYGKRIPAPPDTRQSHALFADPAGAGRAQPIDFCAPPGAAWVRVSLARQTPERRISVQGMVRPRTFAVALMSFEDALISRDDAQLRLQLDQAYECRDRAAAIAVLQELIFLRRLPDDIQMLKVVTDAERTLTYLRGMASLRGRADNMLHQGAADTFDYIKTYTPRWNGRYPVSKWLKQEAAALQARSAGVPVSVTQGADAVLRLMAAIHSGAGLASVPHTGDLTAIDWISVDDISTILPSSGR